MKSHEGTIFRESGAPWPPSSSACVPDGRSSPLPLCSMLGDRGSPVAMSRGTRGRSSGHRQVGPALRSGRGHPWASSPHRGWPVTADCTVSGAGTRPRGGSHLVLAGGATLPHKDAVEWVFPAEPCSPSGFLGSATAPRGALPPAFPKQGGGGWGGSLDGPPSLSKGTGHLEGGGGARLGSRPRPPPPTPASAFTRPHRWLRSAPHREHDFPFPGRVAGVGGLAFPLGRDWDATLEESCLGSSREGPPGPGSLSRHGLSSSHQRGADEQCPDRGPPCRADTHSQREIRRHTLTKGHICNK